VTFDRETSLNFYHLKTTEGTCTMLTEAVVMHSVFRQQRTGQLSSVKYDESLRFRHSKTDFKVKVFPADLLSTNIGKPEAIDGIWSVYTLRKQSKNIDVISRKTGKSRYAIKINDYPDNVHDVILKLSYTGDIGQAFIEGKMIADNFANGAVWEIGLSEFKEQLRSKPLTIYIAPIREGKKVNVESVMAGRKEEASTEIAELINVEAEIVYEWEL
jgi:hypothetical protein